MSPLTPELTETLPPILQPRTYQPVLPTPSPSLAPASMRKRSSNVTTLSALLPLDEAGHSWARHARDEIQLSPSPPPMSPLLPDKFSAAHNEKWTKDAANDHAAKHAKPKSDNLTPTATLTAPFDGPSVDTHWRNNSIDRAFSHMRLGSDVSIAKYRTEDGPDEQNVELDAQSEQSESENVLSSQYRDSLIEEYRDLAARTAKPEESPDSDVDAEATAHELKMVPAPLFWENRQRELYPQRSMYAQQKQAGQQRPDTRLRALAAGPEPPSPKKQKHRKKISLSDAPLQMILPSQYKRKSTNSEPDDSPTTSALKKALTLRLHSKKPEAKRHSAEDAPRLFHGKPISKPMQDGPMPLELPKIAYRDVEVKKPVVKQPTLKHTREHHAWRSSTESGSYGRDTPDSSEEEYTAPLDKDISVADPLRLQPPNISILVLVRKALVANIASPVQEGCQICFRRHLHQD